MRALAVVILAALPALAQDRQDEPVMREYDLGELLRPFADRPAPYIGMLCGVLADGAVESDVRPVERPAVSVLSTETAGELLAALTCVEWGEEDLSFGAEHKVMARHTPDVHKRLTRIIASLKSRLAPEIAVDATIVDLTRESLGSVVDGAQAVLTDARTARLHQLIKDGLDAATPRRMRLSALPRQRVHVAAIEESAYLADVDITPLDGKQLYKPVTATLRTGLTLEIEPSLMGSSVALTYTMAAATPQDVDTLVTVADTTIQLPRVRRTVLAGGLLIPNTSTAFAGAVPVPGKPGWMRALFLRPQIDVGAAKENPEELAVECWPIQPLLATENPENQDAKSERFQTLLRESVEPGTWNEDAGTFTRIADGILLARNERPVLKKVWEWLSARVAKERAHVCVELALVKTATASLGEGTLGEPLSARTVEKLLVRARKGNDASVLWESTASAASGTRVQFSDRVRRPVVTAYPVDQGAPEPLVTIVEWGAVGALTPVAPRETGGRIRLESIEFEFASATEPFPTVAGPGKLLIHLPKISRATFSVQPEVEPGVWTSIGLASVEKDALVLLARASAP